jgi:hypothetical protein
MTRHRFDPLSFIFGALFVIVAAVGLIDRELLTVADLRWIAPGLLVAAGALLLVLSGRRTGSDRDAGSAIGDGADGGDAGRDGPDDNGGQVTPDDEPDTVAATLRSPQDAAPVEGGESER